MLPGVDSLQNPQQFLRNFKIESFWLFDMERKSAVLLTTIVRTEWGGEEIEKTSRHQCQHLLVEQIISFHMDAFVTRRFKEIFKIN